jgi:hypothetical protein
MKRIIYKIISPRAIVSYLIVCLLMLSGASFAQGDTTIAPVKVKPVKNTFQSVWIIDNQTVMVPVKGTLEMDIQHRFGTVKKGYEDMAGLFAPSNIRIGMSYTPIEKLNVGFGITKSNMLWDVNYKYALITQTPGRFPVSITYYGNSAYDSRKVCTIYDGTEIKHNVERFSFFHEIIIARKITERLSVQVAPSISHQNAVSGYYTKNDSTGQTIFESMKHDHFAISVSGSIKITEGMALLINYDQPLTKHPTNNPNPNVGIGLQFTTSSHSFQIFLSNYALLNQQRNNLYNANNPFKYTDAVTNQEVKGGQFLIGFNITKLWN